MRTNLMAVFLIAIIVSAFLFVSAGCGEKAYKEPTEQSRQEQQNKIEEQKTPRTHTIEIIRSEFVPTELQVKKGDTVVWKNTDSYLHGITIFAKEIVKSPQILPGKTFSYTFNQTGVFEYECYIHKSVHGKIIVI